MGLDFLIAYRFFKNILPGCAPERGAVFMNRGAKAVVIVLLVICLLCGILMLFLGISGVMRTNREMKGYETVQGYLLDYRLYEKGEYDPEKKEQTSDTYTLIYNYTVDGKEYTVSTDYGASFVPSIGSTKEIKYNPQNPQEAIVTGTNQNTAMIFGGLFFLAVPLVFLLVLSGVLQKLSSKVIEIGLGMLLVLLGYGTLFVISGTFSVWGIAAYIMESFTLPLLIPLLLLAIGVLVFLRSLFQQKGEP